MRYKERKVRLYFRGDAAFASPEIYEYLEAEGLLYVIRLKANAILQRNIAHLLTRPVGRPPDHVRRFHASFSYQAGSWNKKRRVVAKVEWHPGELVPRVGFIVTNLSRPTKRVVAFYNHRGTAEQHIKEGKNAINWTRLSCRKFRNNAVRLQLHALRPVFLGASGADEASLMATTEDSELLLAILEFLTMDDRWITEFCDWAGLDYTVPMAARSALPGCAGQHWT